ncbi:hypothetical protein D3C59_36430 [Streptomyces sp. SHP22-7]|nr:hypothetical protein D3C59_36430 [Streptomyces sp. SHP22-7]
MRRLVDESLREGTVEGAAHQAEADQECFGGIGVGEGTPVVGERFLDGGGEPVLWREVACGW